MGRSTHWNPFNESERHGVSSRHLTSITDMGGDRTLLVSFECLQFQECVPGSYILYDAYVSNNKSSQNEGDLPLMYNQEEGCLVPHPIPRGGKEEEGQVR